MLWPPSTLCAIGVLGALWVSIYSTVNGDALNFYCDESTHLQNDGMPFLVLGTVWCPTADSRQAAGRIREIKQKHGVRASAELKWTRISSSRLGLYLDVVDYFFDDDTLRFRAVVAPKEGLDHEAFDQTHDGWYYKMYFYLLQRVLQPGLRHYMYLDIKDTRSAGKTAKLGDVLANNEWDFQRQMIRRVQVVRSHEANLLQVADILIGAVNAANRGMTTSSAKLEVIERVKERSGYSLLRSTLPSERKFNVFHWRPQPI